LHILQPNIIIGFEILNLIKNRKLLSKWDTDGWNKIAWGFIKVIGKNGLANTEKKVDFPLNIRFGYSFTTIRGCFLGQKSLQANPIFYMLTNLHDQNIHRLFM
jgi:hypothetical protein